MSTPPILYLYLTLPLEFREWGLMVMVLRFKLIGLAFSVTVRIIS